MFVLKHTLFFAFVFFIRPSPNTPTLDSVVSNFIIQALQGKDLTIYGDGSQTRSFQYVSDLVDGLIRLMNGSYDLPVNLGNPEEFSVKDFAEQIRDITDSKSEIVFLKKQKDDPTQRRPDISTALREIQWVPKVQVKDGLKKAIEYFGRVLKDGGEIIPTGPGAWIFVVCCSLCVFTVRNISRQG